MESERPSLRTTIVDCLVVGSFTAGLAVGVVWFWAWLNWPDPGSAGYLDCTRRMLYTLGFIAVPVLSLFGGVWLWLRRAWLRRDLPPEQTRRWLIILCLVPWGLLHYYFAIVRPTIANPPKTAEERLAELLEERHRFP